MENTLTPELLLAGIQESRLVAIVRGTDGAAAAKAALAAMEEGFRYVEIALTTPRALEAIREVRAAAPAGCFVGAGTVLTAQDVARVAEAGGQFMVTPSLAESIAESARLALPVLAGALTPSEAHEAMNRGATAVKLFPASIGGPGYLKALRDPFPGIPFIAVGGVGLDEAEGYWEAGAIAVGLGGPLLRRCRLRRRPRPDAGAGPRFRDPGRRVRPPARGEPAVMAAVGPALAGEGVDLLTFGESMVSLRSTGPLSAGGSLGMHVAGAESNVAVGVARLGHSVTWAGVVGADPHGEYILRQLRAEGIGLRHRIDAARNTGVMFLEQRTADVTRAFYYRAGSAGSTLGREDLDRALAARGPDPASDRHHRRPQPRRPQGRGVRGRARRRRRHGGLPRRQLPQQALDPGGGPRRAHAACPARQHRDRLRR